jgi:predicted nucleic acid-binding Zn ribbon protein
MLFNKKHQKKVQAIWVVLCALIIVSMVLMYSSAMFV